MANRPLKSNLPADLPENWGDGEIVAADGSSVGLSNQHGYNYLMEQVNAAQDAANTINKAFDGIPDNAGLAGVQQNLTNHLSDKQNPHGVTATQVGADPAGTGKAAAAAVQANLDAHTGNSAIHVTSQDKTKWNNRTVFPLAHVKSGTVHQLSGLPGVTGIVSAVFTAAAAYAAGDTFTVDGAPYAIQLSNGEEAEDNLFVSGASVPVVVDTAGKKVNFKAGGGKKHLVTEIITWSQDWTVPDGVKTVNVRLFGGGGKGEKGSEYEAGGGGGGGHMEHAEISVTPKETIPITIASESSSGNGGISSFGTYLTANGGSIGGFDSGGSGGYGGTGGGGGNDYKSANGGNKGGNATYGGGGGGGYGHYGGAGGNGGTYGGGGGGGGGSFSGGGAGGNGGTYGGGGGGGASVGYVSDGGSGGEHGGNGGRGYEGKTSTKNTVGTNGTNTIGMGLEYEGEGLAGTTTTGAYFGGSGGGGYGGNGGDCTGDAGGSGGGGYGGNGGNVVSGSGCGGSGGGGYGGNGGDSIGQIATNCGGGGGGYGGNGGKGNGSGGGGGGGYGKYGNGGDGGSQKGGIAAGGGGGENGKAGGNGGPGICIITYMI